MTENWITISGIEFLFLYTAHPIPCISVKARKRLRRELPAEIQITSDTVGISCAQKMLEQGVISQDRYKQITSVFEGDITIADGGVSC
ncbi:MAG: hypothetical protein AABZ40_07725 [Thermodesulfobacteriota bacterium]